jgi:magnesium chelatase subunit I
MENVISNAERRAIRNDEQVVVPRISDIYAAMPAITGKLELEYEGEMKGADNVARELIRSAVAKTFDQYFETSQFQPVVQWFDLGGEIKFRDESAASEALGTLQGIQGLVEQLAAIDAKPKDPAEVVVSAAEFVLEGLYAHKRIGRSEERGFIAGEKQAKRAEASSSPFGTTDEPFSRGGRRRGFN